MKRTNLLTYLAAAAIVTIIMALIYATVQQTYRAGANDPQFQIARDISNQLKKGESIDKWFDGDTIDLSQSLSVFNALYNSNKQPVLSNGVLNGGLPTLPIGVFDVAKDKGENAFTWQPQKGVRMAIVLKSLQSPVYSFVAVGRSLYEVENREENHMWMVFISWLLCLGVIIIHGVITLLKSGRNANA